MPVILSVPRGLILPFGSCSLEDLLGIVACETNDKEVILEFTSWKDSHFLLKDRSDFLASMADVMGMEKGSTFSIRLESFHSCTFPEQQNALHQVLNQLNDCTLIGSYLYFPYNENFEANMSQPQT